MVKRIREFLGLLLGLAAAFTLARFGWQAWLRPDWGHLATWVATNPLDDVVAVSASILALACASWLIASSLFYGLARLVRIRGLVRAAEWVTLPVLRRVVDRGLAIALATSTVVAGSAVSASAGGVPRAPVILKLAATPSPTLAPPLPTPPAPSPAPTPMPSPTRTPGYVPTPAGPGPGPASPSTQPAPANPSKVWTTHRVVPGDNLWKISAEHLAEIFGLEWGQVSNRRIASYWLRVVAVNRESLRAGDPDLIFPGEIVKMPPMVQPSEGGA